MLDLKLIGVPEIELDGTPVTFARRGALALLAYLAVSQRAHARDLVATLLAGDSPDDQARKYLSNALVDLRTQLGEYIIATRQTVAFNTALPFRLDVLDFQRHVARCLKEAGPAEPEEVRQQLESALALYRDDFLTGLVLPGSTDFERWQFAQREELRVQQMQLLQAQVEACVRGSAWSHGIAAARRLVAREPWLENAHRQLMLMLARSGQPRAAITQYLECRRALHDELGVQPTWETTALYNRLRTAIAPPLHNLPLPATPFVGRRAQVSLLVHLLSETDDRLVTITGLGGSGKTRLAVEVARLCASTAIHDAEHSFADGVVFVPLFDLARAEDTPESAGRQILDAIGKALCEPVVEYLRNRAILLVLDNLEHLQAGAGTLADLLDQAPHVKILATSRAPLHLAIEHVLHVDGLRVPDAADEVDGAEASALFLQEAHRAQVDYALSAEERPHLVSLCGMLGGFPLGLVLAARWTPLLTCSELVAELGRGLNVLATSESDLPERHRSLTALLAATLQHLPADEQGLTRVLAGVGEGAASTTGVVPLELLPSLRTLRQQGLLCPDRSGAKLTLHPLLRPYFQDAA
jgi:DNA-binding SARP family transcriptional activator